MIGTTGKWRWGLMLLAVGAMVTTGCSAETDEEATEEGAKELVVDDGTQVDAVADESPRPVESEPAVREVDESGIEESPALDKDFIDGKLADEIEGVDLPVLLPRDAELMADPIFVGDENFYTATMHVEDDAGERDHMVVVQGSRMVQEVPGQGEVGHELDDGYHITRIHKVPTLKFEKFGISYQVHVECNRPQENQHCTEDDYIESIADSLELAGGQ